MGRKPKAQKRIRLTRFGACIGMLFEDGGAAEMLMMPLELKRLLLAWMEQESQKPKPDEKTLAALNVLTRKVRNFDGAIVTEVPIAQRKVRFEPLFRDSD
jgi:hypothetical protein